MHVIKFTEPKKEKYQKIQQNRKENAFLRELCAIIINKDGEINAAVTLRTYGTAAKNYACLWIYAGKSVVHPETYIGAGGNAGGYGYHRTSAAAGEAISLAGIELSEPIHGRGDGAIQDAVQAIAEYFFPDAKQIYIHIAHA